jgi:hypothetical protein
MMSKLRWSIFTVVAVAPVAHEVVDFLQHFGDVLAFDPVDRVDAFAGAARIHADAADVAGAFQHSPRIGSRSEQPPGRCREHTKKPAPREAVR